jgi:hypothetical protein
MVPESSNTPLVRKSTLATCRGPSKPLRSVESCNSQAASVDGQPAGLNTRLVEAGYLASFSAGRTGRRTSSPPQFGHLKWSFESAHGAQNVHSKVQMQA